MLLFLVLSGSIQAASTVALEIDGPQKFALAGASTAVTDEIIDQVTFQEQLVDVSVNGQKALSTALLLRRNDGAFLAQGKDLKNWRLRQPAVPSISHLGNTYYLLDALPGIEYEMNEPMQSLALHVDPGLFELTELERLVHDAGKPQLASLGGFLNYDINASHSMGQTNANGFVELGLFGGQGVGTSTFVARNLNHSSRLVRLDTLWTHDMPSSRSSLRVGDAISGFGSWGRSVRFGGVQWATNFSTQPGFITFPLPGIAGEATLPSNMDLYVNGVLRMRDQVPSGPFNIAEMPIMTGQGEVQLVLTDMLGREQRITQSFYASPRVLQAGLHDYSYELGVIRDNYGIANNDYGRFMAVATHRLGLSDRFTGEVRAELLHSQQSIGLGAAYLWKNTGVLSASIAASNSDRGRGGLLAVGFERQAPGVSFGINTQLTSGKFTQLGLQSAQLAPKRMSQAFLSLPIRQYGAVNLNYAYRNYRDREKLETLGASYNISLGNLGQLGISALHFFGDSSDTIIGLNLTRSLGRRTTSSANASFERGNDQLLMQVQRNLPVGNGVGYRLLAGALDSGRREAGFSAQNGVGRYELAVARNGGQTGYRGNISGGIALLGGNVHFSRRITNSFATVQVGDFANVRVYADNQVVALTRADGSALIPRLRAYERNPIRIEVGDLPLDAQIDGQQLEVIPYFRSGLMLEFPVKRASGAVLTILLDNGQPLPAGIMVQRVADRMEFPTGLGGLVYLTDMEANNRLRVTWQQESCEFEVTYPETSDPLPDLGTFTCSGVHP